MYTGRGRLVVGLMLVAVGAALFAVGFRLTLTWLYRTVYNASNVVEAIAGLPAWLRLLVPTAGGLLAGCIGLWRVAPDQNVSNVMEAVALGHARLSLRTTIARLASSWAAIGAGMSIGREGPLIESGGALGDAVARALDVSFDHARVLVAAGTAAGFAAAYNTPLAAILFVLEAIIGVAAPLLLLPVLAASAIATAITRAAAGAGPIYGQRTFGLQSYSELISCVALGVAAAAAAVLFKRVLARFEAWFEAHPIRQPLRATIGGLIVGTIAVWIPSVAGNGFEPLNQMLDTPVPLAAVMVLLVAKVLATSGSVASGVPGGIFTPMLLVGACLGTAWTHLFAGSATISSVGGYALVGMAATTAASIHAPLTAAVMLFELSGDYLIVLPLLLATAAATTVSKALGSESVYEAELRKRGLGWDLTLEGRHMKE